MGKMPRLLLISGLTWYVIFEGSRVVFIVLNMSELHVVDVHTFAVYRIQSKILLRLGLLHLPQQWA